MAEEDHGKRIDRLEERLADAEQLIAELAIETRRGFDQVAEQFDRVAEQLRELVSHSRETDERMRQTDERMRKTDERVDKLVSAIGEFIRRGTPPTSL